ncbi:hypothetical protein CTT34_03545 [Vreelandella aquamarina]|uniref:Uncharacterized protein n=1 Tax=Vreelandella aquamarina TaxID=77097 RepID=A0A857GJS4_9GAMM|nr:hypothetical protein CTT34_03545 [Halomonas meridiana]
MSILKMNQGLGMAAMLIVISRIKSSKRYEQASTMVFITFRVALCALLVKKKEEKKSRFIITSLGSLLS